MKSPHLLSLRVYYEDTDAGGIVYHASYLRFAERARTEMLRAVGFDHGQLASDMGLIFVAVSMNIESRAPARPSDPPRARFRRRQKSRRA